MDSSWGSGRALATPEASLKASLLLSRGLRLAVLILWNLLLWIQFWKHLQPSGGYVIPESGLASCPRLPVLGHETRLCLLRALGRGEWAEVGTQREQKPPEKPTSQPLAGAAGTPGCDRPEQSLGGAVPACPAQPRSPSLDPEASREPGRSWLEAAVPRLAGLPSCLPGLEARVTRALPVCRMSQSP